MNDNMGFLIIEGGKLILSAYFNFMRQAGKTAEEMEALYASEKELFLKNNPANLEDV
jgi:hypothetical protein